MSSLRSLWLLFKWQALRKKTMLPLMMGVQFLFGLGIVLGYPLLFPSIDRVTVLFIATGAPAITMITIGLVAVPQMVSQQRLEGSLDYMRSLPVPRFAYLICDLAVWLIIVVPGVALGVAVGVWRFGLDLSVSPMVVPAILLVALTSSAVGYAVASVLPPMVTVVVTQAIIVFVMMFSPLSFPADRLPGWLETIHRALPIQAMGEVTRGTLASNVFPVQLASYEVLVAWCIIGVAVSYAAMSRRG